MDGAFKDDITATKWTDNHDDKRTTHKMDGPPKRLKELTMKWTIILMVNHHKVDG